MVGVERAVGICSQRRDAKHDEQREIDGEIDVDEVPDSA